MREVENLEQAMDIPCQDIVTNIRKEAKRKATDLYYFHFEALLEVYHSTTTLCFADCPRPTIRRVLSYNPWFNSLGFQSP